MRTRFRFTTTLLGGLLLAGFLSVSIEPVAASDRVRERVDLAHAPFSPVDFRRARMTLRRAGLQRQRLMIELLGAQRGLDLQVLVETATGDLVEVGELRSRRRGYVWTRRTRRGHALPFGEADLAALSGRRVELRDASGELIAQGAFPAVEPAAAAKARRRAVDNALAVRDEVAEVAESAGRRRVEAEVRLRDRGDGGQEFRTEIEGLRTGLTVEVWLVAPDGTETLIGLARDDDGEGEYELRLRTRDGDTLPLGVGGLDELADLRLELREPTGDVLADGTVPRVERTEDRDGDGGDRDEDGEDGDGDGDGGDRDEGGEGDGDREGDDERDGDDDREDEEGDRERDADDGDRDGGEGDEDDGGEEDGDDRHGDGDGDREEGDREGDGDEEDGEDDDAGEGDEEGGDSGGEGEGEGEAGRDGERPREGEGGR